MKSGENGVNDSIETKEHLKKVTDYKNKDWDFVYTYLPEHTLQLENHFSLVRTPSRFPDGKRLSPSTRKRVLPALQGRLICGGIIASLSLKFQAVQTHSSFALPELFAPLVNSG